MQGDTIYSNSRSGGRLMKSLKEVLANNEIDKLNYIIASEGKIIAEGTMELFTIDFYNDNITIEDDEYAIYIPTDSDVEDMCIGKDIYYYLRKGNLVIKLWLMLEE